MGPDFRAFSVAGLRMRATIGRIGAVCQSNQLACRRFGLAIRGNVASIYARGLEFSEDPASISAADRRAQPIPAKWISGCLLASRHLHACASSK
jgi:hypothetical protein